MTSPVTEVPEHIKARYDGLIVLWTHRDATMHQWPPLIVTATGALLALVFSGKSPDQFRAIADVSSWGNRDEYAIWLGVGVPLLLGGLAMMPFLYGMTRAVKIMDNIGRELVRLECDYLDCSVNETFAYFNHPGGWSSRHLIIRSMGATSFGLSFAGCMFLLGPIRGGILYSAIVLAALAYAFSHRL